MLTIQWALRIEKTALTFFIFTLAFTAASKSEERSFSERNLRIRYRSIPLLEYRITVIYVLVFHHKAAAAAAAAARSTC